MKNVLILEDDPRIRRLLKAVLDSLDIRTSVYMTDSLRDAYVCALDVFIDLFVIDIMPDSKGASDTLGIVFAEKIRQICYYKLVPLIFISTLEEPEFYAYSRLHCCGYLQKPLNLKEAAIRFEDILSSPGNRPEGNRHFYFRKAGILYSLETKEIVSIEIRHKKIMVQCVDNCVELPYIPLTELKKSLDPRIFLQCNRSAIVNRRFIRAVDTVNNYVLLTGDFGELDIGRAIKNDFLNRFCNDF